MICLMPLHHAQKPLYDFPCSASWLLHEFSVSHFSGRFTDSSHVLYRAHCSCWETASCTPLSIILLIFISIYTSLQMCFLWCLLFVYFLPFWQVCVKLWKIQHHSSSNQIGTTVDVLPFLSITFIAASAAKVLYKGGWRPTQQTSLSGDYFTESYHNY